MNTLKFCAARMIISGRWDSYTDKDIREAFGAEVYPDHMINVEGIAATMKYRDSGELAKEIRKQLIELNWREENND